MASQLRSWVSTGRAAIALLVQEGLPRVKQPRPASELTGYEVWRNRFMLSRLRLGLWLAVPCLLTFIALDFYSFVVNPEAFKASHLVPYRLVLTLEGAMLLSLLSCVVFSNTQAGRRHPGVLFLCLSWSITLVGQIVATLNGVANPDLIAWNLAFLIQATLIPVRWFLHLVAQLGVLIYFFGVNSALGITIDGKPVYACLVVWVYVFWFCLICNLAVYLYEQLQKAEFHAQRELRFFLHAVSHDLRNPVTGMLLLLRSLLDQLGEQVAVSRQTLERMLEGSDRQLKLINSLLEAHTHHKPCICKKEPLQLSDLVEAVLADFEPLLARRQVTIMNRLPQDLSPVSADATQLRRVFNNLIANAIEHNPPGVTLTLNAKPKNSLAGSDTVYCWVHDNGIGMLQRGDRLFADLQLRRRSDSLGLGLPLCRQIIEAHGGHIGIHSSPQQGTTVWFTLPLVKSAAIADPELDNTRSMRSPFTLAQRVKSMGQDAQQRVGQSLTALLGNIQPSSESANYESWQENLLLGRLRLSLWLTLTYILTVAAGYGHMAVFLPSEFAEFPAAHRALIFPVFVFMGLSLCLLLALHSTKFGQQYPNLIFLGFSWSVTLVPQIIGTLYGSVYIDILSLCVILLVQAALIPVRWWLHVVSQVGALGYYIGVNLALGSTTVGGEPIYHASIFLYLFWFCFICDLAVFLYERLQRNEFESRRQLQAFLHTITHDLRTPVMGASMLLKNLLNQAGEEIPVNRLILERMWQGSDRQLNLLSSLVEAHDTEMRCLVLHCRPLHLEPFVQSVLVNLEPLLNKNQVTLKNLISPDLPPVSADSDQLWRLFTNLITNAVKHNPPGIELVLKADVEAGMLRCTIQDSGLGIQSEQCPFVFELYARRGRSRYVPGLGLGLYVCRQIITAHGGKIGVNSSLGQGSAFWFTLPISKRANPIGCSNSSN
ncbi:HAMP domain-containing sensor histidine kinase [Oculatella sp. FACHB-28]|uniref:sensor histidine kinase n=1 Tax=Oculatella sp. FACHB-28 TaxID=2692845 RepID=UPI0018EFC594|nr:HAMP domain-containing sensor histidine kinase [Oculatella sp. FACHB-28]